LNDSLLLLAHDERGPFWTYKHPTVSDAFAQYVAESPELVEMYLTGARPESIIGEVVCAGSSIEGAKVVVPPNLYDLLWSRIKSINAHQLKSFLSYRSSVEFSRLVISEREDVFDGMSAFLRPIKDDSDAQLLATLHYQGLLPDDIRGRFAKLATEAALEEADASLLEDDELLFVLTDDEREEFFNSVKGSLLSLVDVFVQHYRQSWDSDYAPEDHFSQLEDDFVKFVKIVEDDDQRRKLMSKLRTQVTLAVDRLNEDYEAPESVEPPVRRSGSSAPTVEDSIFRDVDE
jgi:hypothetical protein